MAKVITKTFSTYEEISTFLAIVGLVHSGLHTAVKPIRVLLSRTRLFPGFDSIRQPQVIVFDMKAGADSSWCYVLSLQEFNLPLTDVSSVLDGVASPDSLCGEENTKVWVKSLGMDSPIVNRMRSMGKEWFVPSVGEWRLLRKSYDRLFAMLDTVPQARQIGMNNYWSSTRNPTRRIRITELLMTSTAIVMPIPTNLILAWYGSCCG